MPALCVIPISIQRSLASQAALATRASAPVAGRGLRASCAPGSPRRCAASRARAAAPAGVGLGGCECRASPAESSWPDRWWLRWKSSLWRRRCRGRPRAALSHCVCGHLVEDGAAAALDALRGSSGHPAALSLAAGSSVLSSRSSSLAATAMVDNGVASSWTAPAAKVARTPDAHCAGPVRASAASLRCTSRSRVTRVTK